MKKYLLLQSLKEEVGEFRPLAACGSPNFVEALMCHDVLGDCHRICKVDNCMP